MFNKSSSSKYRLKITSRAGNINIFSVHPHDMSIQILYFSTNISIKSFCPFVKCQFKKLYIWNSDIYYFSKNYYPVIQSILQYNCSIIPLDLVIYTGTSIFRLFCPFNSVSYTYCLNCLKQEIFVKKQRSSCVISCGWPERMLIINKQVDIIIFTCNFVSWMDKIVCK